MSFREPLQGLHDRLMRAVAEVESNVADMAPQQRTWRPAPGKWSAVELVEHLSNTAEPYADRLDGAVARGRQRGTTSDRTEYQYGWFWRAFAQAAGPNGKARTAPRMFRPRADESQAPHSDLDMDTVLPRFREIHGRLLAIIEQADGLDLKRVRHGNPLIGLMRQPIGASFEILVGHLERHLAQLQRLREHPNLPATVPAG